MPAHRGLPPPTRGAELAPLARARAAGAGNAGEALSARGAKKLVHWYCTEKGAWLRDSDAGWIGWRKAWAPAALAGAAWTPFDVVLDDSRAPYCARGVPARGPRPRTRPPPPLADKWFVRGRLNACFNAVDRHVADGRGAQPAVIDDGHDWVRDGDGWCPEISRAIKYRDVAVEASISAAALLSLRVRPLRILMLSNTHQELFVWTLGCARLGAVYSACAPGLAPLSVAKRMTGLDATLVLTDGIEQPHALAAIAVLEPHERVPRVAAFTTDLDGKRGLTETQFVPKRPARAAALLLASAASTPSTFLSTTVGIRPVPVEANYPLFVLYTSGSTGKPKGVVHCHGYVSGLLLTLQGNFDAVPGNDVMMVAATPGWITGQSYMIHGTLAMGLTSVITNSSPLSPFATRFAAVLQRYAVAIFKAGVAFIKTFAASGKDAELATYDLSALRVATFCAEPTAPRVQLYAMQSLVPNYLNSYWATEHGGMVLSHSFGDALPDADATSRPEPWIECGAYVFSDEGAMLEEALDDQVGDIVITAPYPYLARTLWGDPERAGTAAWVGDLERFEKTYFCAYGGALRFRIGDRATKVGGAACDKYLLLGRSDDVINRNGHRLSTGEIEAQVLNSDACPYAYCVAVGVPSESSGQDPLVIGVLRSGEAPPDRRAKAALTRAVEGNLGGNYGPVDYLTVKALPETHTGKYLRRVIRGLARGDPPDQNLQTLKNPEAVADLDRVLREWRGGGDGAAAGVDARAVFSEAVLDLLGTALDGGAPLMASGITSVMTAGLLRRVSGDLHTSLSLATLFDRPTIDGLAALFDGPAPAGGGAAAARGVFAEAVLDLLGTAIDEDATLMASGITSVMMAGFLRRVSADLSTSLSLATLFDRPTIADLAGLFEDEAVGPILTSGGGGAAAASYAASHFSFLLPGGATSFDALACILLNASTTPGFIPLERWIPRAAPLASYGSFAGPDRFFCVGTSPLEAAKMDPQQRWILERGAASLETFEDAGVVVAIQGSSSGVFVEERNRDPAAKAAPAFRSTSFALSVASGRPSYVLGLTLFCASVDTACSSTLTALSVAVACGDAPMLVVGVQVLEERFSHLFFDAGMLSNRGRCHTWDARADGYARAEGVGAEVLERGGDGSCVVGDVKVAQDGRSLSLTAPNGASQKRLLSGVRTVGGGDRLEAHGTGTALGDPVESGAAAGALGKGGVDFGGIKANTAHLEAAAAAAGLLVLCGGGSVPAAANAQARRLNAHLVPIVRTYVRLLTDGAAALGTGEHGRVSSFGYSGTIAHGAVHRGPEPAALAAARAARGSFYRKKAAAEIPFFPAVISTNGATVSMVVNAVIADHVVGGSALFPGVGYVEIAASDVRRSGAGDAVVTDVKFIRPCILGAGSAMLYERTADGGFEVSSRGEGDASFRARARGALDDGAAATPRVDDDDAPLFRVAHIAPAASFVATLPAPHAARPSTPATDATFVPAALGLALVRAAPSTTSTVVARASVILDAAKEQRFGASLRAPGGTEMDYHRLTYRALPAKKRAAAAAAAASPSEPRYDFSRTVPMDYATRAEPVRLHVVARWNGDGSVYLATRPTARSLARVVEVGGAAPGSLTLGGVAPSCGITIASDAWRYRLGAIADVLGKLAARDTSATYEVTSSGLGLVGVVVASASDADGAADATLRLRAVAAWAPRGCGAFDFSAVEAGCRDYSRLMVGLLAVDRERVISLSLLASANGSAAAAVARPRRAPARASPGVLGGGLRRRAARLAMGQRGASAAAPSVYRIRAGHPKFDNPLRSIAGARRRRRRRARATEGAQVLPSLSKAPKKAKAKARAPRRGAPPGGARQRPRARAAPRSSADCFVTVVGATTASLLGTSVDADASLMSAGLDSIGARRRALPSATSSTRSCRRRWSSTTRPWRPSRRLRAPAAPLVADVAEAAPRRRGRRGAAAARARARAAPSVDFVNVVSATTASLLGTLVDKDASLMSAGLDSIGATELARGLGDAISTELPSTLVFDHPSVAAIATAFAPAASALVADDAGAGDEAFYGAYDAADFGGGAPFAAAAAARVVSLAPFVSTKLPGPQAANANMAALVALGVATNSTTPPTLWADDGSSAGYGCFLAGGPAFENVGAFGVSAREAGELCAGTGWLLEATYATLHGNLREANCRAALMNDATGLYVAAGGYFMTARINNTEDGPRRPSVYTGTALGFSVTSGRASYALGMTGPCLSLDTACSSSLVAFHVGAAALRADECPRAGVSGVCRLNAYTSRAFSSAGMLSDRGRCHTFDLRADGYCRGEGCTSVLLDGSSDDTCGVASRSSAVQQDGPSASMTAPNGSSQKRLILATGHAADGGLEAHGTGTALGDPIEVGAAVGALCKDADGKVVHTIQCASLKANMGHLESNAAGAGLAALLLSRMALSLTPPNNQLRTLNTHLAQYVAAGAFRVPLEVDGGRATLAALACRLSSFGFSGTIAHGLSVYTTTGSPPDAPSLTSAPSVFRAAAPVASDACRAFGVPGAPLLTQADTTFRLLPRVHATIADHVVNGAALFPGVGYVEIAASSVMATGSGEDAALLDLTFVRPCVLTEDIEFMCSRSDDGGFDVSSRAGAAGAFASHARGALGDGASSAPVLSSSSTLSLGNGFGGVSRRGFFAPSPPAAPKAEASSASGDASFIPAAFGLVTVRGIAAHTGAAFATLTSTLNTASEQRYDTALKGGGVRLDVRRMTLRGMARQSGVAPASSSELPIFTFGWVPTAPAARDAEGVQVTVIARWNGDGSVFLATPRPKSLPRVVEITGASAGSMTIGGAAPSCSITISPDAWRYRLGAIADVLGQLATSSGASYQAGARLAMVQCGGEGPTVERMRASSRRTPKSASPALSQSFVVVKDGEAGLAKTTSDPIWKRLGLVGGAEARGRGQGRAGAGTAAGRRRSRARRRRRRAPSGDAGRFAHAAAATAAALVGTLLPADASLMSAGLDSIGATDLAQSLGNVLSVDMPSTLVFDHPSIAAIAAAFAPAASPVAAAIDAAPVAAAAAPPAKRAAPQPRAVPRVDFVHVVAATAAALVGTLLPADASLMSAGLDSIGATDLAQSLGSALSADMPSTLVFDHPSISAIAAAFAPAAVAAADAAEGDDVEPAYGAYDRFDAAAAPAGVAPAEVKLAPCVSAKLPGPFSADADMATFVAVGLAANSTTPPSLWVAAAPAGYGCFVRGGVSFDPVGAFGISRREAAGLDPSIGYILEATYATLHGSGDAANCRAALTNDATGLYVGAGGLIVSSAVSTTDLPPTRKLSVYQGTSQACSVASGRASFVLGLTGPCMSIDTACSSSLCAFHVAASALRNDECPRAAVTGVSVLIYQTSNAFATAGMLSDRGRCHTFDLRADGYCRGEGCASFLLDGSSDEACVVASPSSAVQQDGPSASLTAPNGSSQRRLLLAAGSPGDTGVEAHGTGTALGDPIEVGAAVGALCKDADGKLVHTIQCASLKANMGHLESNAAGAGLAALLLSRMALSLTPPNNQLRTLNTHLAQYVAAGAFRMPLEVDGGRATLAALACRLSSFGFSGTIAHGLFVHSTTGPAPDAATLASAPSLFRAAEPVLQDSYHAFAEPVLNGPYQVPQPLPANRAFALLPRVHATLAEHVVNGVALFPGVGYVEIAAASVAARGFDEEVALLDLTFVRPCVLTADIEFMCSRSEDGGFEVLSRAGKAGAFASHARGGILKDATPQPVMSSYAAPPINDVAPARRGFFGTLPAGAPLTKPKTQGDTSFIPAVFGLVAVQGVSARASATFVSASSTLSTATEQGFDACLQGRMLMRRCKLRGMARQSGVAPASSSELPIFTFGWVPAAPAARDAEGVQVTVIARWNGDGSVFLATPRPRGPSRVVEITGASSGSMTIGGAAPSCSITISPDAWRYRLGAIADVLGQLATSSGASYQVAVSGLGLAGVVLPGAGEEASPAFGPCGQDVPIVERIHALSRRAPKSASPALSQSFVVVKDGEAGLAKATTATPSGSGSDSSAGRPRRRRDRPAAGAAPVAVASRPSSAVSAGFELSVASITKSLLGRRAARARAPRARLARRARAPRAARRGGASAGFELAVASIAKSLLGTLVDGGASLMAAGLDSVSSTDLAQALGGVLDTELPSTLVFDHPSMAAIADAFAPAEGAAATAATRRRGRAAASPPRGAPRARAPATRSPTSPASAAAR
ncbi:hypothetical protein SO694_00152034 [Aureococcus anophagefferens]|uniref:Carrier domain-containing protein n=1 Tax=Aureococcus anophagefferens TaxID=44056 RepID=A0ABR1G080_AURAN